MARTIRRRTRRPAAHIVEAAVVLPLCLVFLLGLFEFSRYVMMRQLMAYASREGARYAVVNTYDKTTADVQNVVDERLVNMGQQLQGYNKTTSIRVYKVNPNTGDPLDADDKVVAWTAAPFTNAGFGDAIAVRIQGNFRTAIPMPFYINDVGMQVMPSTILMRSTCVMYSEAN